MTSTENYRRMHPDEFIARVYGFTLLMREEDGRIYGHPEDAIPLLSCDLELQAEAANDAQLASQWGLSIRHDLPLKHIFLYTPLPPKSSYFDLKPMMPYGVDAVPTPAPTLVHDLTSEKQANSLGITLRERASGGSIDHLFSD